MSQYYGGSVKASYDDGVEPKPERTGRVNQSFSHGTVTALDHNREIPDLLSININLNDSSTVEGTLVIIMIACIDEEKFASKQWSVRKLLE